MKKILLGILVLVTISIACKKNKSDSDPAPTTPTVATLSGSYKISKATVFNGTTEIDATSFYPACLRDDVHKLNANLSYELIDAGVQCNPPGNKMGTWSLTNSTTIIIDGTSGTIRKFDGTNLEITGTVNGNSGVIYYIKQ